MFRKSRFSTAAIALLSALLLCTAALTGDERTRPTGLDKKLADGNNAFAVDLYLKLVREDVNLCFSPFSARTALAMTYAGARGNTAEQMESVLHFDLKQRRLHSAVGECIESLNSAGGKGAFDLEILNSLWGQEGFPFLADFLSLTRGCYGAAFKTVDYIHAFEEARKEINDWVEKKTKGRIKSLVGKGILDPLTRLVLVNTIYFKGVWENQFNPESSFEGWFVAEGGTDTAATFMSKDDTLRYFENSDLQVVEIPYKGDRIVFTVLLPRSRDGLGALERQLTAENLDTWLSSTRARGVRVTLPKFKIASDCKLNDALKALGMTDAFDPDLADFTGMAPVLELYISHVLHKAFIDVNEKGTEASAATAVVITFRSQLPDDELVVFQADHPFVFLIRDVSDGSILFIGRVADPGE